nr:PREDICTED: olfactory receptor 51E1-like [Lepisosteus oculatus]
MQNTSYVTIFLFTAYDNNGNIRYLYFSATLLAFLLIIFGNVLLITVIVRERKLHEPMYIFICSLAVNGLYGGCAFYPKCLANLLSDAPSISRIACYIQIFCVHSYAGFEYLILSIMAYDRYLSICHPLRYNSIMTPPKVTQIFVFVCMWSLCIFSTLISLTIRLPLCGSVIHKVYCDNWSVVRHSCVDVSVNSGYGLFVTTVFTGSSFLLVSYSYLRILLVCKKATKEAQAKALQTCTPHLLTFMNYSLITSFEFVYQRFDLSNIPNVVRVIISIDFLLLPPLLNPIIYGIKLQEPSDAGTTWRTWKNSRGVCSRLDYIFECMTCSLESAAVSPVYYSDHDCVRGYWKLNREVLEEDCFKALFRENFESWADMNCS